MRKVKFQMKPNEDKKFKAEVIKNNEVIQTDLITGAQVKKFMDKKYSEDELKFIKKAISKFGATSITINHKE